jgi:Putative ABC exporter
VSLLPRSLLLLIWLRLRGTLRLFGRTLRTPKGLAVTLAGGAVLAMGFVPLIVSIVIRTGSTNETFDAAQRQFQDRAELLLPYAILGLVLLSVVRAAGDAALAFLQAEVDFLFPAPFTRAQLLFYKLAQRVVPLLILSLFLSLWMRSFYRAWLPGWLGILLALWFVHLVALCLALAGQRFESKRFLHWRRCAALLIVAAIVVGVLWARGAVESGKPVEAMEVFARSTAGWVLMLPALPFARTITAPDFWPSGAAFASLAAVVNLALVVLAIRLDAHWLEAGAVSSQKLAAKADEVRRTGGFGGGGAAFAGLRLPMLPRLGGVGPLAWRQLIIGLRQGLRGLYLLAVMVAVLILPPLLSGSSGGLTDALRPMGWILLAYISLFLPQVLRLDFRADVDRLELLKALPVSPAIVSLAQVLVPATIVTCVQAPLGLILNTSLGWNVPGLAAWIPAAFFVNLLITSLENAAFLMWPQRPARGAGMHFAMSQVVGQMLKMLALMVLLGCAAGAALLGYFAAGGEASMASLSGAAAAAAIALAVESSLVIAFVSRLFARFDPAVEHVPDT